MRLQVEFEQEEDAWRAYGELRQAGFLEGDVRVDHPFDGAVLVSVVATAARLPVAAEILERHEPRAATPVAPSATGDA